MVLRYSCGQNTVPAFRKLPIQYRPVLERGHVQRAMGAHRRAPSYVQSPGESGESDMLLMLQVMLSGGTGKRVKRQDRGRDPTRLG